MGPLRLVLAISTVAICLAAQGLAPDVLQVARVRMHLADALTHLPNYTCLETITRWQRQPLDPRLMPLDIVRLEIVYSDRQEWYGSPGERRLTVKDPIQFVGSGMIGNFGMLSGPPMAPP